MTSILIYRLKLDNWKKIVSLGEKIVNLGKSWKYGKGLESWKKIENLEIWKTFGIFKIIWKGPNYDALRPLIAFVS